MPEIINMQHEDRPQITLIPATATVTSAGKTIVSDIDRSTLFEETWKDDGEGEHVEYSCYWVDKYNEEMLSLEDAHEYSKSVS
tara:strand:+ start:773 stop:1021 length:249 start_codon:yes stop_codon:yes gene_type:complete